MLGSLLGGDVVVVSVGDADPVGPLLPEEEALAAGAVPRRRDELTRSRHCARAALRRLGAPDGPILAGPRREPRWPDGVVGSITHCEGYCAAAVAWRAAVTSLGIDAEIDEPLPDGVVELVTLPDERAWLAGAPAGTAWDRVLFSAKESVYKAWFPLTGRWLGFEECRLHLHPATGAFRAELLVPAVVDGRPLAGFDGRWAVRDGLVLTAVTLGSSHIA